MFDSPTTVIGLSGDSLSSGESHDEVGRGDDLAYRLTCLEMADGWVDEDRHLLPSEFEILPLPYLAVVAGAADRTRMNGHDLVRLLSAEQRLASSFEARKLATMAEVAFSPAGDAESPVERSPSEIEYAACEIAPALTLTRRSAEAQLSLALSLTGRLRRVWERIASGDLSLVKARELARILGHLPENVVEVVLDRILDAASELTVGQLRARVSRLALEADPSAVEHGLVEGLADRRVVAYQNPDLTGSIAIQSAHPNDVAEAMAHIEEIARSLKTGDETRTMDQIRNDVAIDLLRGTRAGATGGGGRVVVTIPAATLEAGADRPGIFEGFGPVTAEIARKAVMERIDGEWVFQVTDNGRTVATGTLSRRPTSTQRRRARADYPTCVFPGCRMPSHQCDLDHRRPVSSGGPTHNDNLGPLCRHHHMARHHQPWQMERLPGGDHRWTSPLGHTYTRRRAPPDES